MGSTNENSATSLKSMTAELEKINDKLSSTAISGNEIDKTITDLLALKEYLESNLDDENFTNNKMKATKLTSSAKSKVSDFIKTHREVHAPVSKFGKLIDKYFVCDINHLSSHFNIDKEELKDNSPVSCDENGDLTPDQYLMLVIIEHLLRTGQNKVAFKLAEESSLSLTEVGYHRFEIIYNLLGSIQKGNLEPAKKWLEEHKERLGKKFMHFEYSLAKLEFLSLVQHSNRDARDILNCARKLAPYASEYRSDFEHLMGSLAFLGKPLAETPYTDLILSQSVNVPGYNSDDENRMEIDQTIDQVSQKEKYCEEQEYLIGMCEPFGVSYQPTDEFSMPLKGKDLFTKVAAMFHASACRQLGFSHIDPLFMAFSAGCKVLPKLHEFKHAIESLSRYSTDANVLPISAKLSPIAYRHNIFHCPVIKEMNNHPVRLYCGHAISRDAFNSLASSERSRIKCPYCPIDTNRNQVQDLKF